MGYDQTACLVDYAQDAAEGHSRDQSTRRHLTKSEIESIRTTKTKKTPKLTSSECSENFTGAIA